MNEKLKIVIRADSGVGIGSGHVKRCLVLANELKRRGHHIHFITSNNKNALVDEISQNYSLTVIEKNKSSIEGKYDDEVNVINNQFSDFDVIVFDSYHIDWQIEKKLTQFKIVVIDDEKKRNHYCNIFINQNEAASQFNYTHFMLNTNTQLLLGLDYFILNEEFVEAAKLKLSAKKNRIGIFFGGNDINNDTYKIAQALVNLNLTNHYEIYLSKDNQYFEQIKNLISKNEKIQLIELVSNFAKRLIHYDFFIGAAGSSSWERAYLKIPSAVLITAENQEEIALSLQKLGLSKLIGKSNEVGVEKWITFIQQLEEDESNYLDVKSNLMRFSLNNDGASRIADSIEGIK